MITKFLVIMQLLNAWLPSLPRTKVNRMWWLLRVMSERAASDRGASAVEYGLLVAGVAAAFIVGTAGFNGVLGKIFEGALKGLGATTP